MFLHDELKRVTITVPAGDVDLLDRLAALDGTGNRSALFRQLLEQLRPTLRATVDAFEAANKARDAFLAEAANRGAAEVEVLLPELERLQSNFVGAMARIEGAATAAAAGDES